MIVLGLTGAIASGKSTTAAMFAEAGVPVFSADAAVHQLYRGSAAALVEEAFPGIVVDGVVDRRRLAAAVARSEGGIERLEALIHPLVRREEASFLGRSAAAGHPLVVVEIPLLFETGAESVFDRIVVTTAPPDVRRQRALSRPSMTPELYSLLSSRQLTDEEKRRRADYVVDTGPGLDAARRSVTQILAELGFKPGSGSERATPDA
jgi:dephospho-CoA kinase